MPSPVVSVQNSLHMVRNDESLSLISLKNENSFINARDKLRPNTVDVEEDPVKTSTVNGDVGLSKLKEVVITFSSKSRFDVKCENFVDENRLPIKDFFVILFFSNMKLS